MQLEEFKRKAEAVKAQRRLLELEEEERRRRLLMNEVIYIPPQPQEEHYKITYYDDHTKKYPISQKDRVEKSNKLLDSLFVNDHSVIDAIKYDILVPIQDIKVTQYRGAHHEALEGIKADPLSSNLYLYKQQEELKDDAFDYQEFEMQDDEQRPQVDVIQYMTKPLRHRGHAPESRIEASKVRVQEDIRTRVRDNIR